MKLDLKSLSGDVGARVSFDCAVDMSDIELYGEYPFKNPVSMKGYVLNRAGILELHSEADTMLKVRCARCAKEYEKQKTVEVFETLGDGEDPVEMTDMIIDIDDICKSAVILDMDMVNLCREDCKGLCPRCGKDLNLGECGCGKKDVDPRLAPFLKLIK